MFYVYAIRSEKKKRTYIGQAADVEVRLHAHNRGYVCSTAADRPWVVIKRQSFPTRAEARWFEFQLKRSRGTRLRWLKADGATCRRGQRGVTQRIL
jgi:putative endonuclease